MKECDVCGTPNLKANNYCTHCGNRIAMDNICPFCGELNSDDSSYCSNCNKQIRPVSIDSFEKLFTDYNKLLLAKAEISDEDYSKLLSNIFRKLKGDEILVSDVGNHEFWVSRGYELAQISNRILYSKTFGTLGNAVGKAIGAYYREKKRVVCFIVDQGIQLNIQELQLIAQERIPIAIVIINNNSSGMIMDRERQKYGEHLVHTTQESGYGAPDFKMIADAYRIEYLKATQITKKETDIIVNQKQPILLELMIDKDMKLEPNLPKGETMQKMIPNLEHDRFEMLNKL